MQWNLGGSSEKKEKQDEGRIYIGHRLNGSSCLISAKDDTQPSGLGTSWEAGASSLGQGMLEEGHAGGGQGWWGKSHFNSGMAENSSDLRVGIPLL